jgi:eukaryotic-like serine/threonine-protein kinase
VLVLDFGIAKALTAGGGGPSLSISGELIGSPAYMSPEQASGERVDASSDVYSLGIVGYEMLCGVPPFEGTSIRELAVQHLTVNPPDVRVHRPEVPAPFADALRKCLLKNAAARWSNAESAARAARL